jgi:hypothetical protein
MTAEPKSPNPGSDEAGALGCRCPVMDNNRGKWAPWPPDGWWITGNCPIHRPGWETGADNEVAT